jgi:hypothetical protein
MAGALAVAQIHAKKRKYLQLTSSRATPYFPENELLSSR